MRHKNILAHAQNNEKSSMQALPQRVTQLAAWRLFRILTELGLEDNARFLSF